MNLGYPLPPQPPFGDGTPYGCSEYAYAGAGCDLVFGDYGGYGVANWDGSYADPRPVSTDPYRQYVSAVPGAAYAPDAGLTLSADWEECLGQRGSVAYRRMLLDPQVRSSYSYFKFSVLGAGPVVTPAVAPRPGIAPTPEERREIDLAAEIAGFVERQFARIDRPIDEVFGQLLDGAAYRSMLAEIVCEVAEGGPDAGRTCLKSLVPQPVRAWCYVVRRATGAVVAILAATAKGPVAYDPRHFAVFTWEPEAGDPRGTSILAPAYSAWNEKVSLVPERFKHLTLFGSPSVHYELPPGAQDQYQLNSDGTTNYNLPMVSAVHQGMVQLSAFRSGGQIVTNSGGKVSILNASGDGGAFTAAKVDCNREIATGILLTPGSTMEAKNDSHANAETKQDATGILIRRGKARLAATVRDQIARYVVGQNWPADVAARLTPHVAFGVEHHDRPAMIDSYVKAGWQAPESAYPQMDADVGLAPREAPAEIAEDGEADPADPAAFAGKKKAPDDPEVRDLLARAAEAIRLDQSAPLSESARRDLCHAVTELAAADLRAAGEALAGELGAATFGPADAIGRFFRGALKTVRTAAMAATLALRGPEELSAGDRAVLAAEVTKQEVYLKGFEKAVRDGSQEPGGIAARAEMYGRAAWAVAHEAQRSGAGDAGFTEEMRVLGATDQHCPTCPQLAGKWEPLGSLPGIGQTPCMTSCRCSWTFR